MWSAPMVRVEMYYAALLDGGEQGAVKTCATECCDALGPVYRIDVFERQVILCFGELHAALFGDEGKVFLFVPADFISGNFHFIFLFSVMRKRFTTSAFAR